MLLNPSVKKSIASKGVFPSRYAFTLLIPLRNIFLSPKQLVRRLDLRDHYTVMELGPGPGYFSTKVAKQLPNGRLILTDIQQKMVDMAKKRLDRKGLTNVGYHVCDGTSFPFKDNSFDRIFMVTVLGEVSHKETYMKEFHRMLKNEGILSISELAGDPDKMSIDEVIDLAERNNFSISSFFGNKKNFAIHFRKV